MKNMISRHDFTILLGNVVDHFDTSIYVFLAPILAPLFFPSDQPIISLIMAYSVLATSVITRPLGTYIFGMIAKNSSPARALSYSLIGVGLTTLVAGILPDYYMVGAAAPALLVMFRIFRDIFAAGEAGIAKIYILQDKQGKEVMRGSYLYETSVMLGVALASFVSTFVYYIDIANSWRVVFILGGSAAIVGYLIRSTDQLPTANLPKKFLKSYSLDGIKILCNNKLSTLRIAIINGMYQITYVIPFVVMNNIVPMITDIDLTTMMALNSFMMIFDIFAIPVIGEMVSRYNSTKVMLVASSMIALTIIELWYFVEHSSIIYVTFIRFWIVIWGIVFICPLNLWCRDQVSGDEKYLVVGIGTSIGASIVGKLTPSICLWLYYATGSYMSISFYTAAICALVVFALKIPQKNLEK
ncbi:MFS transporter [Rickettsiaceae bacterium]|nr:MFS transporter [Rickettsiaceae bacterium]